ncbi:probable G-protein coupled receptor B0563.6 isoform X2 [Macrobrachium nipponense]
MVGNLLTIFVLRLPQFRGVTYTLFFVLAISDLLSLFFSISLLIHLLEEGTRVYSTAAWYSYCEVVFTNGPMSTSTFVIVIITVDRYFSVCRPTQFKTIHTKRNARIGIALSLALALIAWGPSIALKEPKLYQDCKTTPFEPPGDGEWWVSCMKSEVRDSTWYVGYSWVRQAVTIFIPVVVLAVLNALIMKEFLRLRRKKRLMLGGQQPKDSPAAEQRKKHNQHLIHLLAAVTLSFFITIVPSGIFGALYDENLSTRFKFEVFRALANDLEILNHALNFYLYILYSKPIRDAISNTLQSKRRLGVMALSHILAVLRKTGQGGSQKGISHKENGTRYLEPGPEVVSENESSFNKIVAVDEPPEAKLPTLNKSRPADTQDNASHFEYPLQDKEPVGNVYQRAVMNHMNKPPHGFHTIVHTAEVHESQPQEESGPLESEVKVAIIQNGHLPHETAHLARRSETHLPKQKPAEGQGENEDEATKITVGVVEVKSSDKIPGGLVNHAFRLNETPVHDAGKENLPNGAIRTPL